MTLLRRLRGLRQEVRFEKFVRRIERTHPGAARRMRDFNSDAGVYLIEQANWKSRVSDLLRDVDQIEADIERQGFWLYGYEWRMATEGSERIEPSDHGFRVETTCHGEFSAAVPSLPVAVEANRVLAAIQKDLFRTLGWSSWERQRDPDGEPYLERLSAESRERYRPRLDGISAAVTEHGEWRDDDVSIRPGVWHDYDGREKAHYEVAVERGRLCMTCTSPSLDRATEFAGIFQMLQADIPRLLEWWN